MAKTEALVTPTGVPVSDKFTNYLVLRNGKIWNVKKRRYQTERIINDYVAVVISQDGVAEQFYVQKLVAEKYVPNPDPENLKRVIHINRDRRDNSYTNLKWGTHAEACRAGRTGEKERKPRIRTDKKEKVRA